MRRLLALAVLATTVASSAFAQQAAPTTFMNNKDIMGLIDKAKADRKGDAPLVSEPILSMAPPEGDSRPQGCNQEYWV